jgi:ribonuclease-3
VVKFISAIRLLFSSNRKFHAELIKILGYHPLKWDIYELAFVHRSASVFLHDGTIVNNERLEFLGDAVLDTIVADYLFTHYPDKDEGFLSKMRSKIVKRKHLNSLAVQLGVDNMIISNSSGNAGKHICGNTLEALVGAIYIDKGYTFTRAFAIKIFEKHINLLILENTETDYKSRIIEWAQKTRAEISFESHEDYSGEAHAPVFISKVMLSEKLLGQGRGSSKKEAEQNAAEQAYNSIEVV